MIFIVELVAFRWGTAKLASIGIKHDAHGHGMAGMAAHGPEGDADAANSEKGSGRDAEIALLEESPISVVDSPLTQIIGVMILEFGVLLHRCVLSPPSIKYVDFLLFRFANGAPRDSVLIGLTLAVTDDFITLFVVIIFHRQSFY